MNKKDLVKAARKGWPNIGDMVDSMLLEMNRAIISRDPIIIHNAFKIEVIVTKPNVGQNFKTGERIVVPSRLKTKFTLSPKINKILNERNIIK